MTYNRRFFQYIKVLSTLISIMVISTIMLSSLFFFIDQLDKQNIIIQANSILSTNDKIWKEFVDFVEKKGKTDLLKQSYFQHRVDEFDNSDKFEILQNLVPLFIITPTYPRALQLPELTRVSQAIKVRFEV